MSSLPIATLGVAAFPFIPRYRDAPHNVARIVAALEQASRHGIRLAVFPEASISGAGPGTQQRRAQLDALAEPFDGPSVATVAQAAERTGVAAGIGWLERGADGRLFNSYAVCMPDGRRVRHRQLGPAGRRIAGGTDFTMFDTGWGVQAGILVGTDNHASENVRMTALLGANLLIAPYRAAHSTPAGRDASACELLSRAWPGRALDNGTFVVFSAGVDDQVAGSQACGAASIVDPCGRVLAETGLSPGASEAFVRANLDLALARENVGQHWRAARRPALYRGLAEDTAVQASTAPERRPATSRGSIALSVAIVRRTPPT
jgi:predicted amidohydrolase